MNSQSQALTTTKKASFWKRLIAMTIDTILLAIFSWLISMILGFTAIAESWFNFVLYYAYNISMENYHQATLGKMILKIKVIKADGANPDFLNSFYRNFGKIVSVLPLFYGYLRILAPHQKQTIHDQLGKCLVVES